MLSSLYKTTIVHQRFYPFSHKFKYYLLSMCIDYDELNLLSKKFDDGHPEGKEQDAPQIDPHVKMNDNYLRTGPYKPKKK